VPPPLRIPQVRVGAVVALGIAAGLGVWLGTSGGGSSTNSPPTTSSGATAVPISVTGLQTLASALHRPIYWAGAAPGKTYELTQQSGRVYLRYLPPGTKIGAAQPFLTVGTYPLAGAFGVTQRLAAESGSVAVPLKGGVAFYGRSDPTSVYLAYPGSDYQIEVFAPSASEARQLVASGRVTAVPASTVETAPVLVSAAQLKAFARTLGHPLYWAGPRAGDVLELRTTTDGRAYVRYLPSGTKAGAAVSALTIGTYPVANAFAVTQGIAKSGNSVQVPVTGGGIAFYSKSAPTSVYLAFPSSSVQIEVFDPSPAQAKQIVTAGAVVPVA